MLWRCNKIISGSDKTFTSLIRCSTTACESIRRLESSLKRTKYPDYSYLHQKLKVYRRNQVREYLFWRVYDREFDCLD